MISKIVSLCTTEKCMKLKSNVAGWMEPRSLGFGVHLELSSYASAIEGNEMVSWTSDRDFIHAARGWVVVQIIALRVQCLHLLSRGFLLLPLPPRYHSPHHHSSRGIPRNRDRIQRHRR